MSLQCPGLLDVAYIIATMKNENGTLSWPAEAAAILALCRGIDDRVIASLCRHNYPCRDWRWGISRNLRTRLGHASHVGNGQRVKMLLDLGADSNAGFPPPLALAVHQGHDAVVQQLLSAGAQLPLCMKALSKMKAGDSENSSDSSTRMWSTRKALIKKLCASPAADISEEDAARLGVEYNIRSLVKANVFAVAVLHDRDWEWLEDVDWRSRKGILLLLAARTDVEPQGGWLFVAANIGDKRLVRSLCALNPDGYDQSLALLAACSVGDLKLVKALLVRGGTALYKENNVAWWDGSSTLKAAQHGHVSVVQYILHWLHRKGRSDNVDHCLMAAVACGLVDEAKWLLTYGAIDINGELEGAHGHGSYLSVACDCAQVEMTRLLLAEGADPNLDLVFYCKRPLLCASLPSHGWWKPLPAPPEELLDRRRAIVDMLLRAGAVLEPVDSDWRVGAAEELARARASSLRRVLSVPVPASQCQCLGLTLMHQWSSDCHRLRHLRCIPSHWQVCFELLTGTIKFTGAVLVFSAQEPSLKFKAHSALPALYS
jgi:hypothetical protein